MDTVGDYIESFHNSVEFIYIILMRECYSPLDSSIFPFFLCQVFDNNVIRLAYEFFNFLVRYILIKVNTDPVFLFMCHPGFIPIYVVCNSPDSSGLHLIQQKSKTSIFTKQNHLSAT